MASSLYDKKAVKILMGAYWASGAWRKDPVITPEDLGYAKAHGVMFDALPSLPHAEEVEAARAAAVTTDPIAVGRAFLASLSSRELAYRSALGSFATTRFLPSHGHHAKRYAWACATCGGHAETGPLDLSCLNIERLKWGGVRLLYPYYAWFDLGEFAKLPRAKPTDADRKILKCVLDAASMQAADARPVHLEKAIAGLFPSNTAERRVVLEILGYCGILQPEGHGSFFRGYPEFDSREEPPDVKNDWHFPLVWWRGNHGVSWEAVAHWFPDL